MTSYFFIPGLIWLLDGNLAELEDVGLHTVQLLDLVQYGEEVGTVLQPRAVHTLKQIISCLICVLNFSTNN